MNRTELEAKIIDASDGALNRNEHRRLEEELAKHPDLLADYHAIMQLPDINLAFPADNSKIESGLKAVQKNIALQATREEASFYDISFSWFRKYALAASVLIVACTGMLSFFQNGEDPDDFNTMLNEIFYPEEISQAEDYVLYLEELSEQ